MNSLKKELIVSYLAGLLRIILGGIAAWLIRKGYVEESQLTTLYAGLAAAILAAALQYLRSHKTLQQKLLALQLPAGITFKDFKGLFKAGVRADDATAVSKLLPSPTVIEALVETVEDERIDERDEGNTQETETTTEKGTTIQ